MTDLAAKIVTALFDQIAADGALVKDTAIARVDDILSASPHWITFGGDAVMDARLGGVTPRQQIEDLKESIQVTTSLVDFYKATVADLVASSGRDVEYQPIPLGTKITYTPYDETIYCPLPTDKRRSPRVD